MKKVRYTPSEDFKPDRLERLAALLTKDASNKKGVHFDLDAWVKPATEISAIYAARPEGLPAISCGTSACAMGLAMLSGEFKEEGLDAEWRDTGIGWLLTPILHDDWDDKKYGFDAAALLFGISDLDAEYLFSADSYPRAEGVVAERAVAKRIRDMIAGYVDAEYWYAARD